MKRSIKLNPENNLSQQCFQQLQMEIIQGILKPGEKLKVEPIKQRFGIGQSPVREALSKLSAFGLVEVEENKGFRVAPVSLADIYDTYATFTAIENMALALAIKHGDNEWEAQIIAQLHKLSSIELTKKPVSKAAWIEQNYNFHLALISGCKSPMLLEIRRHLYMKFDRYCQMSYQLSQYKLHDNHQAHQELARAVLQRNSKEAKKLMTEHINGSLEDIIKEFQKHDLL